MSENYRSAMGKSVDMATLRTQNERVRAVGNMRVNSRGDTIDSNGEVIQDNNKRVNEYYMKAVMNRAARGELPVLAGRKTAAQVDVDPATPQVPTQTVSSQTQQVPQADDQPFQLTEEEKLFEQEDMEIEIPSKIKKNTSK